MEFDNLFGASATERGWVPAPSYVLRRSRILDIVDALPKGELLEVGCGAGALLNDLSESGFKCVALESSASARRMAKYINEGNSGVEIEAGPGEAWAGRFSAVLAFEVLEHIEDDRSAIMEWSSWLRDGGHLLVSVPAKQARWSASDEWAGHYRRYERDSLRELVQECGFKLEVLESYGFPLANIIEPIRAWHHRRALQEREIAGIDTRAFNNSESGVSRSLESRAYRFQRSWLGKAVMLAALGIQRQARNRDWGTGYLLLAQKHRQ